MSGSSSYETHQGTGSSGTRTVTAMFQSRSDAERAVDRLIEEGFSRDDVRLMPGSERDMDTGATSDRRPSEGFWESLADFFFPDSDRDVYAEGLSRGGFLVSVSTTTANHDSAIDILDDDGTLDLDEQESTWRSQGWSGRSGGLASGTGSGLSSDYGTDAATPSSLGRSTATGLGGPTTPASDRMAGSSLGALDDEDMPAGRGLSDPDHETRTPGLATNLHSPGIPTGPDDVASARASASGSGMIDSSRGNQSRGTDNRDTVIPVAEEELKVGKRDVEGGRVRVRSYVVETPVEQQVALRREHVDVRRRPVDRPLTAGEDAFRERTVEMQERSEQPVVSKEARIREEVVLDKDVDTEQRTVSDTVRRTEVEVDDQRGVDAKRRVNDDKPRKL